MAQEYIFRFLSVRPADSQKKILQRPQKVGLYTGFSGKSALSDQLTRLQAGGDINPAVRAVEQFRQTERYVKHVEDLPFEVQPLLDWIQMNSKLVATDAAVKSGIKAAYGGSTIAMLAKDAKLQESLGRLADTLLAETILPNPDSIDLDRLSLAHKVLIFITELASGATLPPGASISDIVGARTLLVSLLGKTSPVRTKASLLANESTSDAPDPTPAGGPDVSALTANLADLKAAHQEISALATKSSSTTLEPAKLNPADRIATLEAQLAACQMAGSTTQSTGGTASAGNVTQSMPVRPVLTAAALSNLSKATTRALASLKLDSGSIDAVGTVGMLERSISAVGSQLASTQMPEALMMLGGTTINMGRLQGSLGFAAGQVRPVLDRHFCDFQAGIGDLLIVRQKLKAYELAEFAATENVLAGETRDREHRRLDTSEDISTTETTTDTQKEKDLQSTQRNEMQSAADKTVKQQFGLEAGLQVSGSYGPTVQFAAHLNASFSTSSEETQKKAISFSQEITSKSSESIRQTIKQSVTHRVLQEIQEINKHAFVNASSDKHIRGIYRWLNKVYDAQIYNYGQDDVRVRCAGTRGVFLVRDG